jgi:hypothetical protein
MYKKHATEIQKFAQQSANNLESVIVMVVLSIQQNWSSVGGQLKDVKQNGEGSRYLWGNKALTYKYLQKRKVFMYSQFMATINSNKDDHEKALSLMKIFLRVPGLGLAKAGFVCQLTAGLVGCIDTHNIRMYGIDEKLLKLPTSLKSETLKKNRIEKYINICHNLGTEALWDKWCTYLATKNTHWVDANHVSEVHLTYLKG